MPALNFKKEFAQLVESGEKRQTIRALRKDGRNPKKGDTLYLYTGMRTKYCRKLGEKKCKSVDNIYIDTRPIFNGTEYLIKISGHTQDWEEIFKIAKADGFKDYESFFGFFEKTRGPAFRGKLIKW